MWISGQKSCILGPTIYKIPQPKYCTSANFRLFSSFAATLALTSGDGSKGTSVLGVIIFVDSIFVLLETFTHDLKLFLTWLHL